MIIQNYKLLSRNGPYPSRSNPGSRYWNLIFKGLEDNQTYTSNVDISMQNFHYWDSVLASKDKMILSNIRLKNATRRLIDADSQPRIVEVIPSPRPPTPPTNNNFGNLFD